jgi:AraC-like DNA-binding protein
MTQSDNRVTRRDNTEETFETGGDPHEVRELRGMLRSLERLGYDLDSLLASVGLKRRDVENPNAYISPRACSTLLARADEERLVPNLPLQLAILTPAGLSPLLDYLVATSASVEQGLDRLSRYLRIVNPTVRIVVRDRRDTARVEVDRASGPFETELCVSLSLLRFVRETDGRLKPAYACFTHEPKDIMEYQRVFGCPVRVRVSWSGWALSKSAMRIPLRRSDPVLGRWLESQAAEIIARQPKGGDIREEVIDILTMQATVGELGLDTVARRLAITPRTLQRRLARADTSFEILCDQARRAAAETYLTNTTLSISEVTYLLGYSEPAAFHRACRRWFGGITAQTFREQHSHPSSSEVNNRTV